MPCGALRARRDGGWCWADPTAPGGELGYLVQLDGDGRKQTILLFVDEIEADGEWGREVGRGQRMNHELRAGDRVRVTERNRIAGYYPGDKGTVLHVSWSAAGVRYYLVAMDKGEPDSTGVIFTEGEIEADVIFH